MGFFPSILWYRISFIIFFFENFNISENNTIRILAFPKLCPKLKTWAASHFFFFYRPLRFTQTPPIFSSSLSFSFFFWLDGPLKLERSLSKFKVPSNSFFEYTESKLKEVEFQISWFLYIYTYEWCGIEAILVEWKSIHEN